MKDLKGFVLNEKKGEMVFRMMVMCNREFDNVDMKITRDAKLIITNNAEYYLSTNDNKRFMPILVNVVMEAPSEGYNEIDIKKVNIHISKSHLSNLDIYIALVGKDSVQQMMNEVYNNINAQIRKQGYILNENAGNLFDEQVLELVYGKR